METEVKIAFDSPEQMLKIITEDWFGDYCLDASSPVRYELDNTYYDTKDRTLLSRGAACRVRYFSDSDEEERYEHTVKLGGKVENGLYQRYEWNVRSSEKMFNVTAFKSRALSQSDPAEVLDEALSGISDDDLVALCRTVFNRTVYTFGFGDSIMEACFDVGRIEAGGKTEAICELELELTSGDVVDLKDMASFIIENSDGRPFNDSKFQRSLRLLDSDK